MVYSWKKQDKFLSLSLCLPVFKIVGSQASSQDTDFFFNIIMKHGFKHIFIFIDTQDYPSLANGNLFKLVPKSF